MKFTAYVLLFFKNKNVVALSEKLVKAKVNEIQELSSFPNIRKGVQTNEAQ